MRDSFDTGGTTEPTDVVCGPHNNNTVGKRRSKIACLSCRLRKVRCDVHPQGSPCTNCRLDQIECTLRERKRKRVPSAASFNCEQNHPQRLGLSPADCLESTQERHQTEGCSISHSPRSILGASPKARDLQQPNKNTLSESSVPSGASEGPVTHNLPGFLHCQLDHISRDDAAYLKAKGCFSLPPKSVVDELLKCYFDYIHPHLPVLDEQEFWETYLSQESGTTHFHHTDGYSISLILFQAILFAATTCAGISILKKAGYNSRSVARKAMFSKVRVLYSLDVEQDKMIILQCLLLMSYWQDDSDNDKDAWHWTGLAVSLALTLRLQYEPVDGLSKRQKTFRKRCWWSCVVRERLVALSVQRQSRISLHQCQLPLLTLADFNIGLRSKLSDLSPGEELGKRTALSMFFIQMTQLFLHIGEKCQNRDTMEDPAKPIEETWARSPLVTHEQASQPNLASLHHWKSNLPEVLQHSTSDEEDDAILTCILVHRNVLHIYFHRILLTIGTSPLRSHAYKKEVDKSSKSSSPSSKMLVKLRNEVMDWDALHYLPRECLEMSYRPEPTFKRSPTKRQPAERDVHQQFEPFQDEWDQLQQDFNRGHLTTKDLSDWQSMPDFGTHRDFMYDFPGLSAAGSSIETSDDTMLTRSDLLNFEALISADALEPLDI